MGRVQELTRVASGCPPLLTAVGTLTKRFLLQLRWNRVGFKLLAGAELPAGGQSCSVLLSAFHRPAVRGDLRGQAQGRPGGRSQVRAAPPPLPLFSRLSARCGDALAESRRSTGRASRRLTFEDASQTFTISSLNKKSVEETQISLQVGSPQQMLLYCPPAPGRA